MAWSFLMPKKPRWMKASAALALVSLGIYGVVAWRAPWRPGYFWGLTFGTVAALIFLLESLYPLRRRLLSWPLGNAQRWLQFHIYGGSIAALLVLIHIGFRWPAGTMGWWLLGLTLWVTMSGLLGVWLQKWIPAVMTESLSVEALYERIPEMIERLSGEADELLTGCSEGLEQVYLTDIRPFLTAPAPSWSYVIDPRGGTARRLAPLDMVSPFVADEDRERLEDLRAVVLEKLELDAHFSLQRCLRYWIVLHSPPAMALLGLVTVHIVAVFLH